MIEKETLHARHLATDALAAFGDMPRVPLDHLHYSAEQVRGDWFPEDS
jgi:hypothetical protein